MLGQLVNVLLSVQQRVIVFFIEFEAHALNTKLGSEEQKENFIIERH
jgi:hypothetical protein